VHAHKFSKSAQEKITKAGGKFESCSNARKAVEHLPVLTSQAVLFTLGLLAVYRIGGHIRRRDQRRPAGAVFRAEPGSVLGFVDLFSGGNCGG